MSITALKSHPRMNKGVTKESHTQPLAIIKPLGKKKVQTFEQMLEKARDILTEATAERIRIVANGKRTIRPWTSGELDKLLKKKHLVHRVRAASGSSSKVRHDCVKELLRQKFLVKTSWGDYKVAPEVLAQAS